MPTKLHYNKNLGRIISFSLLLLIFQTPFSIYAQKNVMSKANEAFLKRNALDLAKSMKANKAVALQLAKEKGWPTFQVSKEGRVIRLMGINSQGLPLYYGTDNEVAAGTTRTNKLYAGGGLGLNLSGSTIPLDKVALWDGGFVLNSHQEFAPARILRKDAYVSTDKHATHVAGTIAASGVYAAAKGMAYGLPNLLSFDFDDDIAEMSANASTLLLSNHSYGTVAGWYQGSGSNIWQFVGAFGDNEDYKFGYYDDNAQNWDNICYNAPYYLPIKSAGNNRNQNGPAVGATYYRYDANNNMTSAGARPAGISSNNGYDIISAYGNAKNILTVGAINGLKYGSISPADISISTFSSWGPTDDGRIKPDLVADGVGLISATSTGTGDYAVLSGTSMAAPNVTGSLVLLQELYKQINNVYMRSATLKALAIGTTDEAGISNGPDYIYGFGLLNAEKAAKAILDNGGKSLITETLLTQGQTQNIDLIASGNGPLVVNICWTDPAIAPVPVTSALNNPTLRLVNDLDAKITLGAVTYSPWILDPANPSVAATTGDNFRDNVEQIYIQDAVPGKKYTVSITHKGTLQTGAQLFSIVATGVGGTAYCASEATTNADSKIENFTLANINHTPATTCTTYGNYTDQAVELKKGETYNLSLTLGTCGANFDKIAKVFIDWNGDGDFGDFGETVAASGVINTTGIYSANITVPNNITGDSFSILRIVMVETADANDVVPCGNYTKGETQDYRVKFISVSKNAAVVNLVSPVNSDCANVNQTVVVKIKNSGLQNIDNVPISVTISEAGVVIANLAGVYSTILGANGTVDFTLPGSFNAEAGKTYIITAKANLPDDVDNADDEISASVQILVAPSVAANTSAYLCTTNSNYKLSSTETGVLYWYKNPTDVVPIAMGSDALTAAAPTNNNSYYTGLNDFVANVGPATKYAPAISGGAGNYRTTSQDLYITTLAPTVIESARLYVGKAGTVTAYLKNVSGVVVSSSTFSVNRTRFEDGTTNDTNDQGAVYLLNLAIPTPGSYSLSVGFEGGASLFRSSGANVNYPLKTALDVFKITGHNGTSTDIMSQRQFYYFFYDMKVRALGCSSTTKLQVPVSNPKITANGTGLISNFSTGIQWYLNSNIIAGATTANYTPSQSGNYIFKVTLTGGCVLESDVFAFDITTLPVNLTDFAVNKTASGALLRWTTATETNNDRFEVYRAGEDGVSIKVGTVLAKGAGGYSLLDKTPIIGNNYYSLKQVDINGVTTTYGPYSLNFTIDEANATFTVYPNPSKRHSDVKFLAANKNESYQLTVTNLLGQNVFTAVIKGEKLVNGYQINTLNWAAGTYLIEISELSTGKSVGWNKLIKL